MARTQKSSGGDVAPPAGKNGKFLPILVVLSGLLLIAIAIAGYFYYQYKNAQLGVAEIKEINELRTTLGVFMDLPEGEMPTLATVTDKAKLAEQPFFQKAENGDKVLIYNNYGRAILYRPSVKKIIDVTAVNIAPPAGSVVSSDNNVITTPKPQVEPGGATADNLRVAIYNASGEIGVSNDMEKTVKNFYPKATITTKETAVATYDDTLAIDVTGKNDVLVESLSFAVKGKVSLLPDGERLPSGVDVLIIIGKNH